MFSSRWWVPVSKRSRKTQDGSGRCCTSTSGDDGGVEDVPRHQKWNLVTLVVVERKVKINSDGLFLDWFHRGKKCVWSRQSSVCQHISINLLLHQVEDLSHDSLITRVCSTICRLNCQPDSAMEDIRRALHGCLELSSLYHGESSGVGLPWQEWKHQSKCSEILKLEIDLN